MVRDFSPDGRGRAWVESARVRILARPIEARSQTCLPCSSNIACMVARFSGESDGSALSKDWVNESRLGSVPCWSVCRSQ